MVSFIIGGLSSFKYIKSSTSIQGARIEANLLEAKVKQNAYLELKEAHFSGLTQ